MADTNRYIIKGLSEFFGTLPFHIKGLDSSDLQINAFQNEHGIGCALFTTENPITKSVLSSFLEECQSYNIGSISFDPNTLNAVFDNPVDLLAVMWQYLSPKHATIDPEKFEELSNHLNSFQTQLAGTAVPEDNKDLFNNHSDEFISNIVNFLGYLPFYNAEFTMQHTNIETVIQNNRIEFIFNTNDHNEEALIQDFLIHCEKLTLHGIKIKRESNCFIAENFHAITELTSSYLEEYQDIFNQEEYTQLTNYFAKIIEDERQSKTTHSNENPYEYRSDYYMQVSWGSVLAATGYNTGISVGFETLEKNGKTEKYYCVNVLSDQIPADRDDLFENTQEHFKSLLVELQRINAKDKNNQSFVDDITLFHANDKSTFTLSLTSRSPFDLYRLLQGYCDENNLYGPTDIIDTVTEQFQNVSDAQLFQQGQDMIEKYTDDQGPQYLHALPVTVFCDNDELTRTLAKSSEANIAFDLETLWTRLVEDHCKISPTPAAYAACRLH